MEKALQQTLSDLHQKNEQIVQLEGIVADQQNALKKEQERMRDLEESRSHLQQQVTILEEEMTRERNTSQVESSELHQRLQGAKDDIDERTRQINELNSTLREVHKDMKHSSASIVELEQLLQQSRTQCDKKTAQAQTLDQALKETRKQLSDVTKKNGELEERLRQMESGFAETTEQNSQLDNEVAYHRLFGDNAHFCIGCSCSFGLSVTCFLLCIIPYGVCVTVEYRYLEPPMEPKIGSRIWGKIVMFH